MFSEEKKKYLALEQKMRLVVSKQWEHLRSSIKRPFLLHPMYWGHKTRSLRRSKHPHAGSTPPLHSQQVPPQPVLRPPGVQNRDKYANKSRILTCNEDGDWQVGRSESEDDTSSESSSLDLGGSREITAEVHTLDNKPICQGTTNSPTTGIEGIIYGDDITSVSPSDAVRPPLITSSDRDVENDEDDVENDEEIFPEVREAMTAHPPPFFSILEDREALAAQGDARSVDERLAQLLTQVEYDDDEDADCSQFDADDEPRDDCFQSNASVQNPYNTEFSAFYANYEEGADYLYYRDEDDDADIFEENEDDDADVFEEDGD